MFYLLKRPRLLICRFLSLSSGILVCLFTPIAHADFSPVDDLPPYVLRWPDGVQQILVADAQSSTLTRYGRVDGRQTEHAVYLSVGQRGVGKQREGDRRTPLGVYFVTEQLDTSDLDPMYGVTAFPLDYPNARDQGLDRDGGGIWLHGVPPGGQLRPPRDTDGCLAIPNDALLALSPLIQTQRTPVIISRSLASAPPPEHAARIAGAIETSVHRWLDSRRTGNTYALAQLYAEGYTRQGLTKPEWVELWAAEPHRENARVEQLFVVADPEETDLYLSRFRLNMDGYVSDKRLYWQRQPDGDFRIVAEDEW